MWISTKKRLPKQPPDIVDENGKTYFVTGMSVLVSDENNKVYKAEFSFQGNYFWVRDSLHPIKVKAWQPLPKAYKGE